MIQKFTTIILTGILTFYAASSLAVVSNSALKSTAVLASTCFVSAPDVSFGQLNTGHSTANSTTSVSVLCSKGVSYSMDLSAGAVSTMSGYGDNIIYGRRMVGTKSSDSIVYDICTNAACTQAWGTSGQNTTIVPLTGTGTGNTVTTTLYTFVNSATYVTPDNYSDTLTITLKY